MKLKQLIVAITSVLSLTSTFAGINITLSQDVNVRQLNRGILTTVVTLPAGTEIEYSDRRDLGLPRGTRYMTDDRRILNSNRGWLRLQNIYYVGNTSFLTWDQEEDLLDRVDDINSMLSRNLRSDNRGRVPFYISTSSVNSVSRPTNTGSTTVVVTDPGYNHGGHTTTTTTTTVVDNSYQVCFQDQYSTYQVRNQQAYNEYQEAAKVGAVVGGIATIFELATGEQTGLSNAAQVFGGILLGVGLIGMSSELQLTNVTYGGYSCRAKYYRPVYVSRPHVIDNVRCTTTEYESHSWNSTVYYYETSCRGTSYVRYSQERWYF